VNVAGSYRFGPQTTIAADELGTGCDFCAFAGDYKIRALGLYVDASMDFDL
jgi:hypothetical protein